MIFTLGFIFWPLGLVLIFTMGFYVVNMPNREAIRVVEAVIRDCLCSNTSLCFPHSPRTVLKFGLLFLISLVSRKGPSARFIYSVYCWVYTSGIFIALLIDNSRVPPILMFLSTSFVHFCLTPLLACLCSQASSQHILNPCILIPPPLPSPPNLRAVLVVVGIMWHYLYTHGGWWAVFKYWAMPYLVFNFWLSTYTYFHHRSAEIGWLTVCLVSDG